MVYTYTTNIFSVKCVESFRKYWNCFFRGFKLNVVTPIDWMPTKVRELSQQ